MGLVDELDAMCRYLYRKHRIRLSQKNFDRGTVRITEPGYYYLTENITFAPNIENGCLPYAKDTQYAGKPFVLGFFAGITIECRDVCLDLNGFEIKQGKDHALMQAFYSHIELCNTPFVPKKGPADFVNILKSACRVVIKNGCLGLSSHHGIHGNGASKVLIENLQIRDFTVSPISLNGGHSITIRDVKAGPNRQDIPVMGTYSAAQFTVQLAEAFMYQYGDQFTPFEMAEILKANGNLHENIKSVFREIMTTGETTDPLYHNDTGLVDGNAYGILIHPLGPAVDEFMSDVPEEQLVTGLHIENVKIFDIKSNVKEIPGVVTASGEKVQSGPAGAVFQFDQVSHGGGPDDRYYHGTLLSHLQIAMARPINRLGIKYGTFGITQDIVDWATHGHRSGRYHLRWKCNGDGMFHMNKGVIGLRIDGVVDGLVENFCVRDLTNIGKLGNDEYSGDYSISHDAQKVPGYRGADCIGVNVSNSKAILFKNGDISCIVSENGIARGIRVMFDSKDIDFVKVSVKDVRSGYYIEDGNWYGLNYHGELSPYHDGLPNSIPCSYGIEFYKTGRTRLREVKIRELQGPVTKSLKDDL